MALGIQFANKLLSETITISSQKHKKGIFIGYRNDALACRFFYYFSIVGLKYERCLQALSKDFFLSETRIAQIIMEQGGKLETLKKEKSDRKALAKMHPQYNWN